MPRHSPCVRVCLLASVVSVAASAARLSAASVSNATSTVVVTATRLQRPMTNLTVSADIVTRDAIEERGAVSIDESLAQVGGVDYLSSGLPGSGTKLDLRGLTPDYQSKSVLVLLDGRRVNEAFQGNVEFSQLAADNVDHATVLRGPASYAYGSGAMAGVVDIVSRNGRNQEPFVETRAAAGNYETWQVRAAGGGQFDQVDTYAAVSHVQTDGYRPLPDDPKLDWQADDYFVNLGWSPSERDMFRLTTGYYTGEGTDRDGGRTVDRTYQTLTWDHAWNPDLDAVLTWRGYNTIEDSDYLLADLTRAYTLRSTGTELEQTLRPVSWLRLVAGGDVRQDNADITDVESFTHREYVGGLFAEADISLSEQLVLSLGARYDKHELYHGKLSPRAALLYRIVPGIEAYVSAANAFRTPGISDRYIATGYQGAWLQGNPDLKPMTLTAYELGLRQQIGEQAAWRVALFYNDIHDLFDFDVTADAPPPGYFVVMEPANTARAHTQGIEADGHVCIGGGFTVFANLSYTDGEYDEHATKPDAVGNQIANLAPVKIAAGIAWHNGRQTHSLTGRYVDEREVDVDNTAKLDSSTVVDWSSRYALNDHVALTLNIYNLFDEQYAWAYDRGLATGVPMPGIRFMAGIEARF
jgi:outer membrane receptor protein involved in Fe transport